MKPDWKKLFLACSPYLLIAWLFNKVGQCYRLVPGADAVVKVMAVIANLGAVIRHTPLPSLHRHDLFVGVIGAVLIRLTVYVKAQNAKKFRHGREYGSARWGTAADIKPFIDPKFSQNILLTQTERIMVGRNKNPKYNINTNVLIIGGSGSGKTRFHIKPNLMQMNASYIVTDPKGYTVLRYTTVNDACYQSNSRKGARLVWHSNRRQKSLLCMNAYLVTTSYRVRATVS